MAVLRDRPYASSRFLVDLGLGDPRSPAAGFSEVVFPPFTIGAPAQTHEPPTDAAADPCLILRRGFTGALDLHAWWARAQRGKASRRRTATIMLLAEDGESVVVTWRFRRVRPVSLTYSPLLASDSALLIETIALAFEAVEMR